MSTLKKYQFFRLVKIKVQYFSIRVAISVLCQQRADFQYLGHQEESISEQYLHTNVPFCHILPSFHGVSADIHSR